MFQGFKALLVLVLIKQKNYHCIQGIEGILLFVLSRNGDKVKITVESVKDGKTEEVRMIDIQ